MKNRNFENNLRLRDGNAAVAQGLTRTQQAVRCWQDRVEAEGTDVQGMPRASRVIAWLLANHIVQRYYEEYGVDVLPITVAGVYGAALSIGPQKPSCTRRDVGVSAWVSADTVRIDPKGIGVRGEVIAVAGASYDLQQAIGQGEDPLRAIDNAVGIALPGGMEGCRQRACRHRQDGAVYLTVYQIITMLLARGIAQDAILGTYVECCEYGRNTGAAKHPLRVTAMVREPQFTAEYFEIELPDGAQTGGKAWIHRSTGQAIFACDTAPTDFMAWSGGTVEQGLAWFCRRTDA